MTGSHKVKSLIEIYNKGYLALLNVEREIYCTVFNLNLFMFL